MILTFLSIETFAGKELSIFLPNAKSLSSAPLAPCLAPTRPQPPGSGITTPTPTSTPTVRACPAACARNAAEEDGRQEYF